MGNLFWHREETHSDFVTECQRYLQEVQGNGGGGDGNDESNMVSNQFIPKGDACTVMVDHCFHHFVDAFTKCVFHSFNI